MKKWILFAVSALLAFTLMFAPGEASAAQEEQPVAYPLWNMPAYKTPSQEAEIVATLDQGKAYPIVGRNAASTWWFIDYGDGVGWILGREASVGGALHTVGVTNDTGGAKSTAGTAGTAAQGGGTGAAGLPSAASLDLAPTGNYIYPVWGMNVLLTPDTSGEYVATLTQGERYPVLGTNADRTWWLIQTGKGPAWARGSDVTQEGNFHSVPIVPDRLLLAPSPGEQAAPTNLQPTGLRASPIVWRMNVRQAPSLGAPVLGKIEGGSKTYPILGRNAEADWWFIDFGSGQGWVYSKGYARHTGGDINTAPVVDTAGAAARGPAAATDTGTELIVSNLVAIPTGLKLLNVRDAPSLNANILTTVRQGERYPVVGRNSAGTWWFINYGAGEGWISGEYARIEGSGTAKIIDDAGGSSGGAAATSTGTGGAAASADDTEASAPATGGGAATGVVAVPLWELNVREGPRPDSEILATVDAKEQYPILGKTTDGKWWLIRYADGGGQGWISTGYANYEEVGGTMDDVPVVE